MKVKAISDDIKVLPLKLQKYAFGQDSSGIVQDHLIVGEEYTVFGYMENRGEVFYLIEMPGFEDWLWWMPSYFYDASPQAVKEQLPDDWARESESRVTTIAPKIYFAAAEDIEDNTPEGQKVAREMKLLVDNNTMPDRYFRAADHAGNNRVEIAKSESCGCYYCLAVFLPSEILVWLTDPEGGTGEFAVCPYCGMEAVLGDASGYPVTDADFLKKMNELWFAGGRNNPK